MAKIPEACKICQRIDCPLHCAHLDNKLEAEGRGRIEEEQMELPMSGTY